MCDPATRDEVFNIATPDDKIAVPMVAPFVSSKVTTPPGELEPVTDAVRVTLWLVGCWVDAVSDVVVVVGCAAAGIMEKSVAE